jgi:biotin-dependent carboxylase-like uncharacterized protein
VTRPNHRNEGKLEILRAGFLTTVQDLGRPGWRQFGISVGGALDAHALRIANLLVGNDESAAGIEITSGPVRLRFTGERIVAWCGGEYEVEIGSNAISPGHAGQVDPKEEISISGPRHGCRGWLAISGGIEVPLILGSRTTDLRGRFGGCDGRPLKDGDHLFLGTNPDRARALIKNLPGKIAAWSAPVYWSRPVQEKTVLRFVRGKDWDRFDGRAHQIFFTEQFTVTGESDRMGARLRSEKLCRRDHVDLISEAVVPGTVQVPPNGEPIVLLRDCQTVGGYPKIAHVISVDLSSAAQLRDGDGVRFKEVSLADAHRLLCEREREVQRFQVGLSLHAR